MNSLLKLNKLIFRFSSQIKIKVMKHTYQLLLFGFLVLIISCKQKTADNTINKDKMHGQMDTSAIKGLAKTDTSENKNQTVAPMTELIPSFVPESGKKNWALEYDDKKEHTVGIFRLPDLSSWQELIATMEYAPEAEIKTSLKFKPKSEWWVSRDIMTNIFQHKLLCYKKKDKNSVWFFAFNKNREVYFWK